MNKFFTLLKVQAYSLFGINKLFNKKGENKKKGVIIGGAIAVFLCALIIASVYVYAFAFAKMYLEMGSPQEYLPTMFALVGVICLFFSFYSTGSGLYDGKDYDVLGAMPIKTHTIVLSKVAITYLTDLLLGLVVIGISLFVQYDVIGAVSAPSLIRLFIMLLCMPTYAVLVSMVLGFAFSYISSKFKKKALIQAFLYIVFMLVVTALSFLTSQEDMTTSAIKTIFFVYPWVLKGVSDNLYFALFCAVGILAVVMITTIVCKTYKKMHTALKSFKKSKTTALKTYSQKSKFKVLINKEFKTLFSSATYASNTLIGTVMAVICSVAMLVLALNPANIVYAVLIATFSPIIYAFTAMMSPTTCVSISVEGNNFYLLRTAPVSTKMILNAKLMVNVLVGALPIFISALALSVVVAKFSVILAVLTVVIATEYSLLAGNLGLICNLHFPYMNWENITKAVKQGVSTLLTVLLGMATAGLTFVFINFVQWDIRLKFGILAIVLAVSIALTYVYIMKNGEKLIRKKT